MSTLAEQRIEEGVQKGIRTGTILGFREGVKKTAFFLMVFLVPVFSLSLNGSERKSRDALFLRRSR